MELSHFFWHVCFACFVYSSLFCHIKFLGMSNLSTTYKDKYKENIRIELPKTREKLLKASERNSASHAVRQLFEQHLLLNHKHQSPRNSGATSLKSLLNTITHNCLSRENIF